MNLSQQEITALSAALPSMSALEKATLLAQLEEAEKAAELSAAREDLLAFVERVYPNYSVGAHHRVMARLFSEVVSGKKSRIIINVPPRFGKSELTSYLLPAWFLGHKPDAKVIMATHTQSLSEDFGRRVRNLIADPEYSEIFPETSLQTDSKSAGVWGTKQGGRYYAVGVGGALAGRGADCAYFMCKVLSKRGSIPIDEVQVGDFVWGYDHGRSEARWTRVCAVSTQFKHGLVGVGRFVCTPEHLIHTAGGYKPAAEICDADVHTLRETVRAATQGAGPYDAAQGAWSRYAHLLFSRLFGVQDTDEHMRMRGVEEPRRHDVQGVLFEGQARRFDVPELRKRVQTSALGAHEKLAAAWEKFTCVLRAALLPNVPARASAAAERADWGVKLARLLSRME